MKKKCWRRLLYGATIGIVLSGTVYSIVPPLSIEAQEITSSSSEFQRNQLAVGQQASIEGVVVSPINAWGGNSFFVQTDYQQGLFIYPKNDLGIQKGDRVQLVGTIEEYSGALQLTSVTDVQVLTKDNPVEAQVQTLATLQDNLQGTYITLENMRVSELKSVGKYQNSSWIISDQDGLTLPVYMDNRSGVSYSTLAETIKNGDLISIKGILYANRGRLELKPYQLEDIILLEAAEPVIEEIQEVANIGEIQGLSHTSPLVGKKVHIKDVVVTKLNGKKGFYIQDMIPDNHDGTSDALYVWTNETVAVGDRLELIGEVLEQTGDGYADKDQTDLTITQLKPTSIQKVGIAALPTPLMLERDRKIPRKTIDDDQLSQFQPEEDAIDFWESLEGMLVEVETPRVLGPQLYGELYVLPQSYQEQALNSAGGLNLQADYANTEIIGILVGNRNFRAKAKDYFTDNIQGTVTYSYGGYKVDASGNVPKLVDGGLEREISTLLPDETKLLIASYNIENFSANNDAKETPEDKVEKIAYSLIHEIHSPDIISLIEVQDDNGSVDDGTVSGAKSGERLINKIQQLGGPLYQYVEVSPENNADGGKPGANIRVAFLYNPQRVSLVEKESGTSQEAAQFVNGSLEKNPARIAPTNAAFTNVRKSLAAEFEFKGERVVVIANHLKSKRGDDSLYGLHQPAIEHSQAERVEQAAVIHQFVQEGLAQNPELKFVLTGDFNDFEFSKTIQTLEGDLLVNLLSQHDMADRYSYFFRGNQQSLDNILVSKNIANQVAFDAVHVNSSFMAEDGRASDHDPLVVQISFAPETISTSSSSHPNASTASSSSVATTPSQESVSNSLAAPSSSLNSFVTNSNTTTPSYHSSISPTLDSIITTAREVEPEKKTTVVGLTTEETELSTDSTSLDNQGVNEKVVTSRKVLPRTGENYNLLFVGGIFLIVLSGKMLLKQKLD